MLMPQHLTLAAVIGMWLEDAENRECGDPCIVTDDVVAVAIATAVHAAAITGFRGDLADSSYLYACAEELAADIAATLRATYPTED